MTYTSVSSKYQIVIPKEVRNHTPVKPGQKFIIFSKGGIIHLVPVVSIKKLKGALKGRGVDLVDLRDKSDRPL